MKTINTLDISSFEQLVAEEQEIVRRINEMPNGGRLLLLDPLRLLREVGVNLSDDTIAKLAAASDGLFAASGGELAYDAVAASDPEAGGISVSVEGLLPKGGQRT